MRNFFLGIGTLALMAVCGSIGPTLLWDLLPGPNAEWGPSTEVFVLVIWFLMFVSGVLGSLAPVVAVWYLLREESE
jgi:hypothetical protein